jgi:hypothetical protein
MTVTTNGGTFTAKEIDAYKQYLEEKFPNCEVESLILEVDEEDGDFVKMNYTLKNKEKTDVPFERIRRISGYLVGTLERWNNAKRQEEHDRVKHGISQFNV